MDEIADNKLKKIFAKLPKFPDGRVDYTNAKEIYGVSVIVEYQGKILFLKRAEDLHFYPGLWNVVSGFIDEPGPLGEHVFKELKEETGIDSSQIADIKFAKERVLPDLNSDIEWHIYPVLVRLASEPNIEVNWEHTEYRWILPEDASKYDAIPSVTDNIRAALELIEARV